MLARKVDAFPLLERRRGDNAAGVVHDGLESKRRLTSRRGQLFKKFGGAY
jgi:hypothetical protein